MASTSSSKNDKGKLPEESAVIPEPQKRISFSVTDLAKLHTNLSFLAFLSALVVGCLLHYKKIVKNGVAGYPQEWFPSVSATIGDWFPERNIFQILIAMNSGPRFALVYLQYLTTRSNGSYAPLIVFISGVARTLSCGGWVYITSSDDHDAHDFLMITYIVLNIPWMFGGISCTPLENTKSRSRRKTCATLFFASIVPMLYFFVKHKVHRVPGAYTRYSFFEWGLIFLDILYDSSMAFDFDSSNLQINVESNTSLQPVLIAPSSEEAEKENPVPEKARKSPEPVEENQGKSSESYPSIATVLSFIVDIYLAYIFWSIFTSLVPTLFYFSVWELGLAGAELALLSLLSPVFLGFLPSMNVLKTPLWSVTLDALSLFGLFAYKLSSPLNRLFAVAFANSVICIQFAVNFSHGVSLSRSTTFGLGLLLSSLSKHANYSNNPVWPMVIGSSGYNKIGISLALLAIAFRYIQSGENKASTTLSEHSKTRNKLYSRGWFLQAVSLGTLLFSLQCFLTDSSTLIAWTWTGYPIKGPLPHMHGSLTLIAQSLGLFLPLAVPAALLRSPLWYSVGAASAFILYRYDDWFGFYGALVFAVFLMSITPSALAIASPTSHTSRFFFTTFLTVILFYLASVWTVAYAFVPGGSYLRERTDLVLAAQILLLSPFFNWKLSHRSYPIYTRQRISPWFKLMVTLTLSLSAFAACAFSLFQAGPNPLPYKTGSRILNAGIWTVHFGIDNKGRDSQKGMTTLIKDLELDIVGLLETDLHRIPFGNRDLTRQMLHDIGYYVDLGPGPHKHTWGAALLSKFPILNSTHHLLPSPNGELAPAISAVLDVWGTNVTVVVAHNGQEEDALDRELQSRELARIMEQSYPDPVIFLGYVVSKPHAPYPSPYEILIQDGKMHDIDKDDYDRWCEYILFRGLYRTAYLRMSRGIITDTELQVGQFVLPSNLSHVTIIPEEDRYLRCRKEALPEVHWFPMEYYGNDFRGGKNGHFYHVFGTPLYYRLPQRSEPEVIT